MLRRKALDQFEDWYRYRTKQALLVTGARQVGKTYLVREFARTHWENVVEINLFENPAAAEAETEPHHHPGNPGQLLLLQHGGKLRKNRGQHKYGG